MSIRFKFALAIVAVLAAPALLTAASEEAQARGGFYGSYGRQQMNVRPIRPMVIGTRCNYGHRYSIPRPMTGRPDQTSLPGRANIPPHPRPRPCLA